MDEGVGGFNGGLHPWFYGAAAPAPQKIEAEHDDSGKKSAANIAPLQPADAGN
jgi:hypothetical protein